MTIDPTRTSRIGAAPRRPTTGRKHHPTGKPIVRFIAERNGNWVAALPTRLGASAQIVLVCPRADHAPGGVSCATMPQDRSVPPESGNALDQWLLHMRLGSPGTHIGDGNLLRLIRNLRHRSPFKPRLVLLIGKPPPLSAIAPGC